MAVSPPEINLEHDFRCKITWKYNFPKATAGFDISKT